MKTFITNAVNRSTGMFNGIFCIAVVCNTGHAETAHRRLQNAQHAETE